MFWEEPRVPGLPGAEDVTDGSVDYYDTDWGKTWITAHWRNEMQKCGLTPCEGENNVSGQHPGTNRPVCV